MEKKQMENQIIEGNQVIKKDKKHTQRLQKLLTKC